MSATSLILVVASVVSVHAGTANLDKGREHGLEPGDRGQIYYQLTVAGQPQRIDVGSGTIGTVEDSTATLTIPTDLAIRAGYRFEVQVPNDRLLSPMPPADEEPSKRPASVPAGEGANVNTVAPPEAPTVPAPIVAPALVPVPKEDGEETPVETTPAPDTIPADMILIPAGRYPIGLDITEAEFFSQTPQFTIDLPPFWIDRHPTTERSFTYTQAQAHCRNQGKRLPTEIEWETAVQQPEVSARPGLLEWTASWYQPYPGNTRPENEFGQRYRVLRGSTDATTPDPHARRYLAPTDRNPGVGFRCALDQP